MQYKWQPTRKRLGRLLAFYYSIKIYKKYQISSQKIVDTILFCCYTIKVLRTYSTVLTQKNYLLLLKNTIICAGVAQQVEQLTCNQQVGGSIPSASSKTHQNKNFDGFFTIVNVDIKPKTLRFKTVEFCFFHKIHY